MLFGAFLFCFATFAAVSTTCNIMTDNGHPPKNIAVAQRFKIEGDTGEQIKYIASRLPPMCEEYNIETEVLGIELQNRGIFEIKQGGIIQPVEVAKMYSVPGVALRNLNHVFKLRKFYYANGILGIHQYLMTLPGYEAT